MVEQGYKSTIWLTYNSNSEVIMMKVQMLMLYMLLNCKREKLPKHDRSKNNNKLKNKSCVSRQKRMVGRSRENYKQMGCRTVNSNLQNYRHKRDKNNI